MSSIKIKRCAICLQLSRFGADWRMENDEGKMRKKRKRKKRVKRNKKVITGLARDKNGKDQFALR
jgi:hypothetical protein